MIKLNVREKVINLLDFVSILAFLNDNYYLHIHIFITFITYIYSIIL